MWSLQYSATEGHMGFGSCFCSSLLSCHSLLCPILQSPHCIFKLYSPDKQNYLQFIHPSPLLFLRSLEQPIFFLSGIPATTSSLSKILFILQSSFQMWYLAGSPPWLPLSSKLVLGITIILWNRMFISITAALFYCIIIVYFFVSSFFVWETISQSFQSKYKATLSCSCLLSLTFFVAS